MKMIALIVLSGICCHVAVAQHKKGAPRAVAFAGLKDAKDSLSYALGASYAGWMKQQGVEDINYEAFRAAVTSTLKGDSLLMDDKTAYMTIQQQLQELLKARSAAAIAEGEKFLAENKTKPGIVTLPDGLQYQVLREGNGPKPTADNRVKVHYKGQLINGKVFDSSIDRGQPAVFGVSQVIKGWTEALQLMPVGSKWRLFIPSSLAYGDRQAGSIPPNSVLIFEVELLSIEQ